MNDNIYVDLTRRFNDGRLRAVISSGQAVVLHQLAIMSKDGDWILREDEESFRHVLTILDGRGARYRFGAPLGLPWMKGGWSSHFEFGLSGLRIRTDFVTRPPRTAPERLQQIWREQEGRDLQFVDVADLAQLKKTNREKDYAVIGELARRMTTVEDQLLHSRSARDIVELCRAHPEVAARVASARPALGARDRGIDALEAELDAERRQLMHANERRLSVYLKASEEWLCRWPGLERRIAGMRLIDAHEILLSEAQNILPCEPLPGGIANA